ncbi:MAG: TniB family NTP-binding protein [Pseudomonadota bacterium]
MKQVVHHPLHNAALLKLEQFHLGLKEPHEIRCMLITGESGSGKTTLVNEYMSRFPFERHPNVDVRRVLYVRAPSRSSVKSLGLHILRKLGGPIIPRMSDFEVSLCVRKLLCEMGVELLFIDEVQDLLEWKPTSNKIPKLVANFIKEILQETNTGIVLMGSPSIEVIPTLEVQLGNRTGEGISLDSLRAADAEERAAYREYLAVAVKEWSLPVELDLSDNLTALRFQVATDGRFSLTNKVLHIAKNRAALEKSPSVRAKHFEYAFVIMNDSNEQKIDPFKMGKDDLLAWVEVDAMRQFNRM